MALGTFIYACAPIACSFSPSPHGHPRRWSLCMPPTPHGTALSRRHSAPIIHHELASPIHQASSWAILRAMPCNPMRPLLRASTLTSAVLASTTCGEPRHTHPCTPHPCMHTASSMDTYAWHGTPLRVARCACTLCLHTVLTSRPERARASTCAPLPPPRGTRDTQGVSSQGKARVAPPVKARHAWRVPWTLSAT